MEHSYSVKAPQEAGQRLYHTLYRSDVTCYISALPRLQTKKGEQPSWATLLLCYPLLGGLFP